MLALVALLGYGLASKATDDSIDSQLAAGKRPLAPAMTLGRLDGSGSVSLASYRGQVVVLNFWASWCGPCQDEAPVLQRWHRRLSKQGGGVLGIDVLDVTSDAKAFVRKYGLTYTQVRDPDGSHLSDFGVRQYPETVVVDRRGRIAAVQRGPVDDRFFSTKVVPLVKEKV